MPPRRSLRMESVHHHPPSKIPLSAKKHPPLTGIASSQAGKIKVIPFEEEVPQTQLEKLDYLRSKLEQSVDAFITARKELEEITAEGSSQQGHFPTGSSADLKIELKRHRELTSRIESSLKTNKDPKNHHQGRGLLAQAAPRLWHINPRKEPHEQMPPTHWELYAF